MSFQIISILIFAMLVLWISAIIVIVHKHLIMRDLEISIEENTRASGLNTGEEDGQKLIKKKEKAKLLSIERKLLDLAKIKPNNVMFFIWIERTIIFIILAGILVLFKGLAFAALGAILVAALFNQMHKDMIYRSGIESIPETTNFLNTFIPTLSGGNSPAQAAAIYIKQSENKDFAEYMEQRDLEGYVIPPHIKTIVDAYLIAEDSERSGMGNYIITLNEMAEDYNQKSSYYNKFLGSMGEIKPISFSYYIGVPTVIATSLSQTADFWKESIWSWPLAVGLVVLFATYKGLTYKLESSTIKKIF